ncbi:MAG: hypothetical protein LBS21_11800 [Clostridiales bacterium]|jgi:hypothetical protein|nr:hypothetical protein [Clostridiales bacterium]
MKRIILCLAFVVGFAAVTYAVDAEVRITPLRAEAAFKSGKDHWGVYNGKPYYYYGHRYHAYYRHGRRYYYYDYYDSYDYQRGKAAAAYSEIERLEDMKKAAENAKREMKGIKIKRARFYKEYTSDSAAQSMAEVEVQNDSSHHITEFYFRGNSATARGKVLINDHFEFFPQDELQAGQKAAYKIPLNAFGAWAGFKAPPDNSVFTVTLDGMTSSDGQTFSYNIFSSDDQKRLDKLKNAYVH